MRTAARDGSAPGPPPKNPPLPIQSPPGPSMSPEPSAQKSTALTTVPHRSLRLTLIAFLERTSPASRTEKPACISKTRLAANTTQIVWTGFMGKPHHTSKRTDGVHCERDLIPARAIVGHEDLVVGAVVAELGPDVDVAVPDP